MHSEADAQKQKRDESIPERIIRAVSHCRTALLAGYTTYRDLGSEGMGDYDANMRDAIARGLMPGPRLFVATRIIASTGGNEVRTENPPVGGQGLGPDVADGPEAIRQAVRRRIAAGADVVKVFVDYRRRIMRSPPAQAHPYRANVLHPSANPNPNTLLFSQAEVDMVVAEARLANCPIAAHALTLEGAMTAIRAGVTTLEHGVVDANENMLVAMRASGCILVPTLAILERLHPPTYFRDVIMRNVRRARELGVRFACGGDTGTFNHGENAREMELMIECGLSIEDVLEAATVGGWAACGADLCGRKFGVLEVGAQADIIALASDPRSDKDALRKVSFVMADAKVWKMDGSPVGIL